MSRTSVVQPFSLAESCSEGCVPRNEWQIVSRAEAVFTSEGARNEEGAGFSFPADWTGDQLMKVAPPCAVLRPQ